MKRAIERHIVFALANLLATQQVRVGDMVRIDWDGQGKELTFTRESEDMPMPSEALPRALAAAASGNGGLGRDVAAGAVTEDPAERPGRPAAAGQARQQSKSNNG